MTYVKRYRSSFIFILCLAFIFSLTYHTTIAENTPSITTSSDSQDVVKITPGVPTLIKEGSLNKYTFENLTVVAPKGKLIKNVIIQFTSAIDSQDKIEVPTMEGFSILSGSTIANQSINSVNEEGLPVEKWEEYLRKVVITLSNNNNKMMRFTANTEKKADYIYDYNAENKHYYQLLVLTEKDFIEDSSFAGGKRAPRFSDAYQAIEVDKKFQYMGRTGYMATVTNQQEMEFVTSVIKNGDFVWLGATSASPYIDPYLQRDGYTTNPNDFNQGLFYWVSGPEKGQIMWQGLRHGGTKNLNDYGYPTYWMSNTTMEFALSTSGTHSNPQYDYDGLYVATYPTKATYWVWCDQPEDVPQDGTQGYGQQVINWMIEYDDIPEISTSVSTVQSFELDPKLEAIAISVDDIKYGESIQPVVTKGNHESITEGLTYTYYGLDHGQYTLKLDSVPQDVGSYKVVVSGDGYTTAETIFHINPLQLNVNIHENTVGQPLDILIHDENGKDPINAPTYTYYQKDEVGNYSIPIDQQPTDAGDYKVVVSIKGYEDTEKEFTIAPKPLTIYALGNEHRLAGTITEGAKLSNVRMGHSLSQDQLLLNDTIDMFGEPEYTWYTPQRAKIDPENITLKEGDVYILSLRYDHPTQSLSNYHIEYKNFTLTVVKQNHLQQQITITIDETKDPLNKDDIQDIIEQQLPSKDDKKIFTIEDLIIYDKDQQDITQQGIDLSESGEYLIRVTVVDKDGNRTKIDFKYLVEKKDDVISGDQTADITIDQVNTSDQTDVLIWILSMSFSLGICLFIHQRKAKKETL